jgi:predicted ATP-binding protein involved in virulence
MKYKDFKNEISVILAPNGGGKTTTLINLETELKKKNISVFLYSHYKDNYKLGKQGRDEIFADVNNVIYSHFKSEGEELQYSFNEWLEKNIFNVMFSIREHKSNIKELCILIDELDSGLSLDKIIDTVSIFEHFLKDARNAGVKMKIILSANSYELASQYKNSCYWLKTGKLIKIDTYDDFKCLY